MSRLMRIDSLPTLLHTRLLRVASRNREIAVR
jgi:hypothetical protein